MHAHDSRQNFTLNLLMDPEIDLVTIAGNAGTGNTCGMAYAVERFRDWPHAGHVTLKSVERSRLALAAEELL